jgi:N-acetylmuramoyl-L-alanine amidase
MSITISEKGIITSIPEVQRMLTPKNTVAFSKQPDTIIIHYTAGSSGISSANWLTNPTVKASAHVVIDKSGTIYQIVPFANIAWHAGQSAYGGRKDFNNFSIGIELDNPGFLTRAGSEFMAPFGTRYPANQVIEAVHRNEKAPRFWHTYSEAQIAACEELCLELMAKYPSIKQILGHEEIAPGRKQDPGPAFPLERFRAKLLQNNRESDTDEIPPESTEGTVIVDKLNIREGAGADFEKVAKPLPLNKKVKVLGERNGWLRVEVKIEGWVSKAFISKSSNP